MLAMCSCEVLDHVYVEFSCEPPSRLCCVQEPVERLSLASDGAFLASAGHDSCVHIWDIRMLAAGDDGDAEDEEEGDEAAQDEDDGAHEVRLGRGHFPETAEQKGSESVQAAAHTQPV